MLMYNVTTPGGPIETESIGDMWALKGLKLHTLT